MPDEGGDDLRAYLLEMMNKQPKENQLSGGVYMEQLMKKGEYGQLSEEEMNILSRDFHFKPNAFKAIWSPQGVTYGLQPPGKLGMTIVGDPNAK